MPLYDLPTRYRGKIEIDVCLDCNAIWFDQYESSQLSPDATVALFELIHERGGTATSAAPRFGQALRCVTCGERMRAVQDRVRNSRFAYQACPKGHGRLTTFYNFLLEKQFVRELTKIERAKLAATVHQVRCSGCGAAVDLGKVEACAYCRAPISVFDRESAQKAIDRYLQERQKQKTVVVTETRERPRARENPWRTYDRSDLGADILGALGRAASRWLSRVPRASSASNARAIAAGNLSDGVLESLSEAAANAGESAVDLVCDGMESLYDAVSE